MSPRIATARTSMWNACRLMMRTYAEECLLKAMTLKTTSLRWFTWPNRLLQRCQRESSLHPVAVTNHWRRNSSEKEVVPTARYTPPPLMLPRLSERHCPLTGRTLGFQPLCMTA
ncbi:hypothetical protein DPMN_119692 [Dreissena polymorpha]|uniref:Uncharacterized protein n=1 Tax=Dreissena polymorpha TaxID=45954 RepID=A0A9D4GMF9_DREPO|nr:hypothetical protein DPMN_119692 [Dreissena polymorpha]